MDTNRISLYVQDINQQPFLNHSEIIYHNFS